MRPKAAIKYFCRDAKSDYGGARNFDKDSTTS